MPELQVLIPTPHDLPAYRAILAEFQKYPCALSADHLISGVWEHLSIARFDLDVSTETFTHISDSLCSSFEYHNQDHYTNEEAMYNAIDDYTTKLADNIGVVIDYYRPYSDLVAYTEDSVPNVVRTWPTVALLSIEEASLCNTRRTST